MRKQRRFHFSIRTLLAATMLLAVPFAMLAYNRRIADRQMAIVKQLKDMGGTLIMYECDVDQNWNTVNPRRYPDWIEDGLGRDGLYAVVTAFFESSKDPDEFIKQASKLRRLRMLKLPGCHITANSLEPLKALRHLEWLDLFMTPADDDSVRVVSKIKSLRILDLRNTKVTDNCIDNIASLTKLSELLIIDTGISEEGVQRLRRSLPHCKLVLTKADMN